MVFFLPEPAPGHEATEDQPFLIDGCVGATTVVAGTEHHEGITFFELCVRDEIIVWLTRVLPKMRAGNEARSTIGDGGIFGRDEPAKGDISLEIFGISIGLLGDDVVGPVVTVKGLFVSTWVDREADGVHDLGFRRCIGFFVAAPEPVLGGEELGTGSLVERVHDDFARAGFAVANERVTAASFLGEEVTVPRGIFVKQGPEILCWGFINKLVLRRGLDRCSSTLTFDDINIFVRNGVPYHHATTDFQSINHFTYIRCTW